MEDDLEEIQGLINPNINTALKRLGEQETNTLEPISSLDDYEYIRRYIYKLVTDNEALNLVVDKLTAKEDKKDEEDKWVSVRLKTDDKGDTDLTFRISDIDRLYIDKEEKYEYGWSKCVYKYKLYLKGIDDIYLLSKDSYEELKKILVGNK